MADQPSLESRLTRRLHASTLSTRALQRAERHAGESGFMARAANRRAARSARWAERIALRQIGLPGARRRARAARSYAQAFRGWGTSFDPTYIETMPPWLAREQETAPVEQLAPFVGPRPSATILRGWGAFAGVPGSAPVARTRAGALSRASGVAPPRGFQARRAAAPPLVSLSSPLAGTPSQVSFAPSSIARPISRTVAAMQRFARSEGPEATPTRATPLARAEARTARTPALARGTGQTLAAPTVSRAIARADSLRPTGRGFEVSRAVSRRAGFSPYSAPDLALPQAPAGFGLTRQAEPEPAAWSPPQHVPSAPSATVVGLADSAISVARSADPSATSVSRAAATTATAARSTAVTARPGSVARAGAPTASWSSAPLDPTRPVRTSTAGVARAARGVATAATSPLARVAERARSTWIPESPAARIAARAGHAAAPAAPAYGLTRRAAELPTASAPTAVAGPGAPSSTALVARQAAAAPLQRAVARSAGRAGPTAVRQATLGLGRQPAMLSSTALAVAAPAPATFLDAMVGEPAPAAATIAARPLTRSARAPSAAPASTAALAESRGGVARSTASTAGPSSAAPRSTAPTAAAVSRAVAGSAPAATTSSIPRSAADTATPTYRSYSPASRAAARVGAARSTAPTALTRALAAGPASAPVAGGAIGRAAARAVAAEPVYATALASTSPVARSVARSAPAPTRAARLPWAPQAGPDLALPTMPAPRVETAAEPVSTPAIARRVSRTEAAAPASTPAPLPGPTATIARSATGVARSSAPSAGPTGPAPASTATVASPSTGAPIARSVAHRTAGTPWTGAPTARRAASPASRALARVAAPAELPGSSATVSRSASRHSGTPAVRAIARYGLPGSTAPTGRAVARSLSVAAGLGKLPATSTHRRASVTRTRAGVRRSRLVAPDAVVARVPETPAAEPETTTQVTPRDRRPARPTTPTSAPPTRSESTSREARPQSAGAASPSARVASADWTAPLSTASVARSPLARAFERGGVHEGPAGSELPAASAPTARGSSRATAGPRTPGRPRPLTGGFDPVLPQAALPGSAPESSADFAWAETGPAAASAPRAAAAPTRDERTRAPATSSVTRALARAAASSAASVVLPDGRTIARRPGFRSPVRTELPDVARIPGLQAEPGESTAVTATPAGPGARSSARVARPGAGPASGTAPTAGPGRGASRSTARTASVRRSARIGAPEATLPSRRRPESSATTADAPRGPAAPGARTARRVARSLTRALQRDADLPVGIAARSALASPDLVTPEAPEALLPTERADGERADGDQVPGPARRSARRSRLTRPSTTLPRRFARRTGSTALKASAMRSPARSTAVLARVDALGPRSGFPDVDTGSDMDRPVADASGLVARAARRMGDSKRTARTAGTPAELPRKATPKVTISQTDLARMVRKEVAELTTISAPAPTVHRSRVQRAPAEQVKREEAPSTQQSGAAAGSKDLEDFLRRAVRRLLKEEQIRGERDLTPWD